METLQTAKSYSPENIIILNLCASNNIALKYHLNQNLSELQEVDIPRKQWDFNTPLPKLKNQADIKLKWDQRFEP